MKKQTAERIYSVQPCLFGELRSVLLHVISSKVCGVVYGYSMRRVSGTCCSRPAVESTKGMLQVRLCAWVCVWVGVCACVCVTHNVSISAIHALFLSHTNTYALFQSLLFHPPSVPLFATLAGWNVVAHILLISKRQKETRKMCKRIRLGERERETHKETKWGKQPRQAFNAGRHQGSLAPSPSLQARINASKSPKARSSFSLSIIYPSSFVEPLLFTRAAWAFVNVCFPPDPLSPRPPVFITQLLACSALTHTPVLPGFCPTAREASSPGRGGRGGGRRVKALATHGTRQRVRSGQGEGASSAMHTANAYKPWLLTECHSAKGWR